MKKIVYIIISFVLGFFSHDIIWPVRNTIDDLQIDIVVEDIEGLKKDFFNNPCKVKLDSIWRSIPYQVNELRQYDLFPYTWYVAFQYGDYNARYTLHGMLTDTLYDDNHYIPNSTMKEFAQRIQPPKEQIEK